MKQLKKSLLNNRRKWFICSIVFAFILGIMIGAYKNYAAAAGTTLSIVGIDYDSETLTVKSNIGDTKIYYSNSAQKSWETVYGSPDSEGKITMDISWISKSSSYVLSLKGDKSTTPIKVTLPKQATNFRVTLDYTTNLIDFKNYGSAKKIYWRKANSTNWKLIDMNNLGEFKENFKNEVERFSMQGITLYFRIGQIEGTSTNAGSRPSKEVALKIAKRAAAPNIKVDFSKAILPVKATMEYKYSDSEEWLPIKSNKIELYEIAEKAIYSDTNTKPEDVSIDIRTKATSARAASQKATIKIPAQKQTFKENISISYIGATQAEINIVKQTVLVGEEKVIHEVPSSTNPYEYTIVKENSALSDDAKWIVITSSKVRISKEDAPVGSKIYIRKKATDSAFATVPYSIIIGSYPSISTVDKTELKKVSGVESALSFSLTVPTKDTGVTSIKFNGTEVSFTTKKAKLISETSKYAMDVTITDTSKVEAVADNLDTTLTAMIALDNGDVINEGVTLYVSPATTIKTKVQYEKYLDIAFDETIKFVLKLNSVNKENVTVSKITYNNEDVLYKQETDKEDLELEVSIIDKSQFDKIEESLTFTKLGTEIPFVITLSSGEVISSGVTLKVKPIVTISSEADGFGISAGTYNAALKTESTADDIANPIIKLIIDEDIYKKYDLIIASVQWNNREIMGMYSNQRNVTTLTLSISNMIEGLDFTTKSSYSGFVKITLNEKSKDKFKEIETNYKITVVK